MSAKQELHRLVDLLDLERVEPALEYLRWLLSEDDVLSDAELTLVGEGEAEIARGEFTMLAKLAQSLDE